MPKPRSPTGSTGEARADEAGPSEKAMFCIRCTKERVWLLEYDPTGPFADLKWTWTLEWVRATQYPSEQAAMDRAAELGVKPSYYTEKAYEQK